MTKNQQIEPLTLFAVVAVAFAGFISASATQLVTVNADRVNLRAAPDANSEVVGQVSSADTLVLQGSISDAWVKVTPPAAIDLWIFGSLVKDGKVTVSKAQVRSGAGLNFNVVGQLQNGDPITIRGKVGDWIKIAPFPTSAVWITNSFVVLKTTSQPISEGIATPLAETTTPAIIVTESFTNLTPVVLSNSASTDLTAATPSFTNLTAVVVSDFSSTNLPPTDAEATSVAVPQTASETNATPEVVPAPPEPIEDVITPQTADPVGTFPEQARPYLIPPNTLPRTSQSPHRTLFGDDNPEIAIGPANVPASRLRRDINQATSGSYSGMLALVGVSGAHPAQYRLVEFDPAGHPQTVCYVLGNNRQLDSLKGSRFTIEGPVYWFKNTTLPTIFAQDILRHSKR